MGLLLALLSSLSTFATSPQIIVCSDPQEALYVEINATASEAIVKNVNSSAIEVMKYLDTDSGILYFEGPVHIFSFTPREGSTRGIGHGHLADRTRTQLMWCQFKK